VSGTAADVLREARATIGQHEDPFGSNLQPFAACAGHANGYPWCASWVVCMAKRAGVSLPGTSAYTPSLANSFKADGRWGSRPSVGAFVFFTWPSMGRIAHVGIVEAVRADGSIVTIEGNTDAAGGRTGGRVMRHVRRANITGYGYPRYERTTVSEEDDDMGLTADEREHFDAKFAEVNRNLASLRGNEGAKDTDATHTSIADVRREVAALAAKVGTGGGTEIDYDLLADKVADRLATRRPPRSPTPVAAAGGPARRSRRSCPCWGC
jgi:hypothetical protein